MMPILTVTSGANGLGTTTVATNLAVVLARLGRRVSLLDLSVAPGVAAQRLGTSPTRSTAAQGKPSGSELVTVMTDGPYGLRVLAAGEKSQRGRASRARATGIVESLRLLAAVADFVVVDLPAGPTMLDDVVAVSERLIVVTGSSPGARRPTRALVSHVSHLRPTMEVGVIVNGVSRASEADRVYLAISTAAQSQRLHSYGLVNADPEVRRAQMMQRAVVDCRPRALASRCLDALGRRIAQGHPSGGGGLSRFPTWTPSLRPRLTEVRLCA